MRQSMGDLKSSTFMNKRKSQQQTEKRYYG